MSYMKRYLFTFIIAFITIQCLWNSSVFADDNGSIIVLVYHHILPEKMNTQKSKATIVSKENFEKQMNYLYKNKYNIITLDELYGYIKLGHYLPKKSVLITFDDGYESNYIFAYPILKKYRFRASIFMIANRIKDETSAFDPKDLSFMSKVQMGNSSDIFEFACHTYNLHILDPDGYSLLTLESDENIKRDLHLCNALVNTKYFSYPYGKYSERLQSIIESEGFKAAFTIKNGAINRGSNIYELNRNVIFSYTSLKEFEEILESR